MKLLDPRTIQSNITAQRKTDIDQGLQLARKVDTLRETFSQEEAKLTAFRDFTVKEVQKQIDAKIKERDILVQEIISSQKVHDHLSKLLDEEWGEVDIEKEQLGFLQKRIDKLSEELETKIRENDERLKQIAIEEERQRNTKLQIEKQAEQSSNILIEAQNRFTDALDEEKRVSIKLRKMADKNDKERAILQATVNDIAKRERELEAEYKFINEEKIRIADQRATLERAIARIKK
jgi:hypothetical protein